MLCYSKKIERQPLNELGNDNEQPMCESEKVLKDEINAIKEKIRALTEEKEKCEKEYHRMCNLKKNTEIY